MTKTKPLNNPPKVWYKKVSPLKHSASMRNANKDDQPVDFLEESFSRESLETFGLNVEKQDMFD
jgi:hypothetical protein